VGVDFPGNDIQTYPNASKEECTKYCKANKDCNLFVVYKDSVKKTGCWLKTKAENAKKSNDMTTYAKINYTLPA
jgi:hypothetical protein